MLTAADHKALHEQFLKLAGEMRVIAHRTGLVEELAGVSLTLLEISTIYLQMSQELERRGRIMRLRNYLLFMVIIAMLLLGAVAVSAQDETPAVTDSATLVATAAPTDSSPTAASTVQPTQKPTDTPAAPIDVLPVDQAARQLLMVIMGIIGSVVNAPVTTFLSGLLKKIPLLDGVPARTLAVVTAGVLVILTWLATYFGFKVQLDSLLNAVLIGGPVIMQFVITLMGSHAVYSYAAPRDLPIIGYQRPQVPKGYKSLLVQAEKEQGQGLVEYALILVLVAVVVIVVLALLGPAIGNIFSNIAQSLQCGAVTCPQ